MKEMLKDCISLSFVSHICIYMEEIKSKNAWIPEKLNFADCTNFSWNYANRGRELCTKRAESHCKYKEAYGRHLPFSLYMFRNSDI